MRLGTVTAVNLATGLCTVTVDGTDVTALAVVGPPHVGAGVWVEQRGASGQDWVITDTHPPARYFEQWDFSGATVPNNSATIMTPQNSMFLIGATAWSGNTWTAPVEGIYLMTAVAHPLGAATNRAFVRIQTGGGLVLFESDNTAPAALWCTATGCEWQPAGQTIQINMFQNTGVGQTQDGVARVAIAKLNI